jgi:hypothetical protein
MKGYTASGIYAYLSSSGVLDTGTSAEIANARKAYWRDYKRRWKAARRKNTLTIIFSDTEMKQVSQSAKLLRLSRTRYIKQCALKQYVLPDTGNIRDILFKTYNLLLTLSNVQNTSPEIGYELLNRLENLEKEVLFCLTHPKTINSDH